MYKSLRARRCDMLYQDRRALRTVRNCVMWCSSLAAALPVAMWVPRDILAVSLLASAASMLLVYAMLLTVIHR